jgi:hypothetical protein
MDLTDSTSLFTSIERKTSDARYSSYLQCFSTTESVSWVDIRMPGKAVVSWEHHRDFDRSLELLSIDTDDSRFHHSTAAFAVKRHPDRSSASSPSILRTAHVKTGQRRHCLHHPTGLVRIALRPLHAHVGRSSMFTQSLYSISERTSRGHPYLQTHL